ncbi:MAG: hypothetical protein JXA46_12145 [Dehalococcoidales bacterium]|nr:hypothetical protein [Dehalococcoidales bacterium]
MSIEKRGIPTVGVVTQVFEPLARLYSKMVGRPEFPVVFVPQPVKLVPAERCRQYAEGNDPVTGRPVIDELVEGLTRPLTSGQKKSGFEERPSPRLLEPDTEENLHRYFLENKMTDFLPIYLPTEEKVEAMLKGTSHEPDEVVGEIRSGYEAMSFTVEKVAANAVMAGARPEYLPVILAMAASGVACIASSTGSFTSTIVINGPIRNEIKMNSGLGAMGPFNQANAVLGRAGTLLSISAGGGQPGSTYWGYQGNPLDYNHCTFAENEELLPAGWKPFHVQNGFDPGESVVSFMRAFHYWGWSHTNENEKHKAILQMATFLSPSSSYCLLLDPIVAEELVGEGFPTKESVSQYVYDNSWLTYSDYWKYDGPENNRQDAERGIEPWATLLKQPPGDLLHRFDTPAAISLLVVGGRSNDFWKAGDWAHIGSYSIDEWR